jgi:hypothetical protein
MNRYEKHLIDKREKNYTGLYQPRINANGGWDEVLCGACALAAIQDIGRCDHVEHLMEALIPRFAGHGGGFISSRGSALLHHYVSPVCGHTEESTI